MITLYSSFRTKEFSCSVPSVKFAMTYTRARVTVTVGKNGDDFVIYDEFLFPDSSHFVELADIDRLIEPWAQKWLIFQLDVHIEEQRLSDEVNGASSILYSNEKDLSCSQL